jgi:protease PrsW
LNIGLALIPVLLLLALLQLMDSFKLVRPATVATAIAAGAGAAIACLALHDWIVAEFAPDQNLLVRYIGPATEEIAKASFIAALLWRRRIGFVVDAAVLGFSVGAGFALVENVDYLRNLDDGSRTLWLVRGLGTAVLHAATTAVFAIVGKTLCDRTGAVSARALLPGLGVAVAIHAAFNHLILPPLAMTAVLMLVLPLVVMLVFERSERVTRDWIGAGLDLDLELIELLRSEAFASTRFGNYLRELRARFSGPAVADMFCLLRLELELSIQAKALLMARQAGLHIAATSDLAASLGELNYLHSSIGRTGLLALRPLHLGSDRDRWLRFLLASHGRGKSQGPV